jgi:hypothetical protein
MSGIGKLAGSVGLAASIGLLAAGADVTAQNQSSSPTFSKDVLPILQRSCQKCHRPGTGAPMSLLTYQDVRPWVRSIRVKVSRREMPPWHIDRSIGEYLEDPSLSAAEIATMVSWMQFADVDEWTYGEPDLVVRMEKGFKIPADGPDFTPDEIVDPGITEDRYVKWVQIIPDAKRAVHHSHVYVQAPEDADTTALGLGMGSNTGNEVDLIEYGTGNDADIFPDGTTKIIKAGSKFRFSSHYHPYGEETYDRQKVGIKFYPKGVVPKYVVTSHRIRTGVGNDWALNREAIEDLLLRAGHKLDIDEPAMPTGALVAENPLHGAARAVLAAAAARAGHQLPAAHAFPRQPDDPRGDPSRRPPRGADRRDPLRAELADHLQVQDAASVPERDHPPHHLVARQHREQPP